jgi:hypothetical protein
MNEPTDTELKQRYDELESRVERMSPAERRAAQEEIDRDFRIIVRDWRRILERRAAGDMTDQTHMDFVKKTIREESMFCEIPVSFSMVENFRDDRGIAWTWKLFVTYAGDAERFQIDKWKRLMQRCVEQTAPRMVSAWMSLSTEWHEDEHGCNRCRETWMVKTEIWFGPPRKLPRRAVSPLPSLPSRSSGES